MFGMFKCNPKYVANRMYKRGYCNIEVTNNYHKYFNFFVTHQQNLDFSSTHKFQIIGNLVENVVTHIACFRCGCFCNNKMPPNYPMFDITCSNCKQKTQVKSKKDVIIDNGKVCNIKANSYIKTLESINESVDYICISYSKVNKKYVLKKLYYTPFEYMHKSDILLRGNNSATINLHIHKVFEFKY